MARQKNGVNMSQAVRDVLNEDPKMKAKEIIKTLADKGITVKPGLVYFIKGKVKGKRGRRKKMQAKVAAAAASTSNGDAVATILKVKTLATNLGGLKKLKALVDALTE